MQGLTADHLRRLLVGGILIAFLFAGATYAAPTVVNGNFSDVDLNGWAVEFGTVTNGGGYARFQEDAISLSSTLSQAFQLPVDAKTLSFDVWIESVAGGQEDPFSWPDAFTASLLDPITLNPLIASPGYTDFYYLDNTGVLETVASVAGNTVSLNVSGLAGQNVLLSFDLWGGYDGMLTTVGVDNVKVSGLGPAVPAPSALLLAGVGTGFVARLRRKKSR